MTDNEQNISSSQYETLTQRRRRTTVHYSSDTTISKTSYGTDRCIRSANTSSQSMYNRNISRRVSCIPFWGKYSFGAFLWLSLCLILYQSDLTWANCTFMDNQCTYNILLAPPGAVGGADGNCSPVAPKEERHISGTQESQNDYAQQMTNIVKDFDYMKGDHEKRIKELEHYVLKLLDQINSNANQVKKQGSSSESRSSGGNEVFNGVSYTQSEDDRLIKTLHKEFTTLRAANKEKSHKIRILSYQLNETRQKLVDTNDALITNTEALVKAEQTLSVIQDDKYILQNRLKDKSARLFRAEKRLTVVEKRNKEIDDQLLTLIRSENNLKEELHTYKYRLNDTIKLLDELQAKYDRLEEDYALSADELVLREKELMVCVKAKTQSFCGFEDPNICGFTQANGTDNFDWTHAKGSTPSGDTGPDGDHTCKSPEGHFMHLEASAKGRGHTAILSSPTYKSFTSQCVQFYYHMFGRHMGTLNVYTQSMSDESNMQSVWRAYGNQGNVWIKARLSIPVNLAKLGYHIVFEGSTETGYQGDMAIDDITVEDGDCPVDPHLRPVVVPDVTTTRRPVYNRTVAKSHYNRIMNRTLTRPPNNRITANETVTRAPTTKRSVTRSPSRSKKRRRKRPRGHSRRRHHNGTRISTE